MLHFKVATPTAAIALASLLALRVLPPGGPERPRWTTSYDGDPESCFAGPFPMFEKNFGPDCVPLVIDHSTGVIQGRDPVTCSGPEVPEYGPEGHSLRIPEEESRYTTEKYGCVYECDFNSVSNAILYAEQLLWPITSDPEGRLLRTPCGGERGLLPRLPGPHRVLRNRHGLQP